MRDDSHHDAAARTRRRIVINALREPDASHDMGALNNIGNYHGDCMRGLTESAPETPAPQIKVTVNQPPIQNKVKGYYLFSGDSLLFSSVASDCCFLNILISKGI